MCYHFSEGDSGIFTSSYHSEQDSDPTFRLSVSQSFGKSFPDISEDGEDVPDSGPIRGQYPGHVTSLDQSEPSDTEINMVREILGR